MPQEVKLLDAIEDLGIYGCLHPAQPVTTAQGVPYFQEPGIAILSKPQIDLNNTLDFLRGFETLDFEEYLLDAPITPAIQLVKFAGQLCYLSFGKNRTKNRDTDRYLENIFRQGHGSILEHSNFSILLYGVSRSLTHELIRHRAGFAYSQVSQRFVETLRFVERPEFQKDSVLHDLFIARIEEIYKRYDCLRQQIKASTGQHTRKDINQAARALLNNEIEAPILVTANARALRHFLSLRGSLYAEPEIRNVAIHLFLCLSNAAYLLFSDFKLMKDDSRGLYLETPYKKV